VLRARSDKFIAEGWRAPMPVEHEEGRQGALMANLYDILAAGFRLIGARRTSC